MEQRVGTLEETTGKTNNPYVFIVGCARSGTTLLHRVVDAHPLIAITPEMHWITRHSKKWKHPTPGNMVTPELASELAEHRRFSQLGISREEFEGLLASGEPISYRSFLDGIFDLYGKAKNKPLVGNKTPAYVRSISSLHALWPGAKFVHIIRDGRDVCLSMMNWKKANRNAGRHATWTEDPVSTTALWWERKVRLGREAGASLGPGLYHEVRYEALVARPADESAALCEFLDVPYDDAMVRFHEGKTRTDLPDARKHAKKAWLPVTSGLRNWSTEMPADVLERFEAAAGDLLGELGYARAFPRPSAEKLEHASRMREAFTQEVRERKERLPEGWRG